MLREHALRRSAYSAKRRGYRLVSGAFEEFSGRELTGVCVLAAHNLFGKDMPLALPNGDELAEAWDSIEAGWDGELLRTATTQVGEPVQPTWWRVGANLREMFSPVPARET